MSRHADRIGFSGRPLPKIANGLETISSVDGGSLRVVQLNNAATTPPFLATLEAVNRFLAHYGALHRGAGPRARLTCEAVEQAILAIRRFVNAGADHAVLFTENTSAAVNMLARLLRLQEGDAVVTSEIEHTSNYLPWRFNGTTKVVESRAFLDGSLDYADLEAKAETSRPRLRVIAVSGASNQTGYIPDLRRVSQIAHRSGALLFVDAAQLAPHRQIDMVADGIDALAFSAHKLYAPFGLGVLVVPHSLLDGAPVDPGGGSIDMISNQRIIWSPPGERHQTGTWNATGIVALGASCSTLMETGWDTIAAHERELMLHTAARLDAVPGLRMHVPTRIYRESDRIGVFPFTLNALHHARVAAILEHEYGIEVRAGTICNHRLVRRWFALSDAEQEAVEERIAAGDRLASYGIVRASLGIQNGRDDIDALAEALTEIATSGAKLDYRPMPAQETYEPV